MNHRDARPGSRASLPIARRTTSALVQLLAEFEPKLVVLAGFMRILTPQFIGAFAGRILNVHPSLLPKYRGLHTHRRALESGEALHGVSVHFVTEELDGGPVIRPGRGAGPARRTAKRRFQREFSRANTGSTRRPSTGSRAGDCC